MENKSFYDFTNKYQLSKTLRFELKPVGKTEENLSLTNLISEDEERKANYKKVKVIIDRYHKKFISSVLNGISETGAKLDWSDLAGALKNKDTDAIKKEQAKQRKTIIKYFEEYKESGINIYKNLFKKELFSEILVKECQSEEEQELIKTFDKFSTYFTGFHENRKNMYSEEEKSTSVAYRIVNDNFPKFLTNIEIYEKIKTTAPEIIEETEKELAPLFADLGIKSLEEVFNIKAFNKVLSQEGIDCYNLILSGKTDEAGKKKTQGINEKANLWKQQNKEKAKGISLKMLPLFKQILSDRETLSFIPEKLADDKEVIETIYALQESFEKSDLYNGIKKLFNAANNKERQSKLYIANKNREKLSAEITGNWENIRIAQTALKESEEKNTASKTEKYLRQNSYTFTEINEALNRHFEDDTDYAGKYFVNLVTSLEEVKPYQDKFTEFYKQVTEKGKETNLKENIRETEIIKNYLDAVEKVMFEMKILENTGEVEIDTDFYSAYDLLFEEIRKVVAVYDKVRNYITQKPYSEEKFKLNFECPTLADGWDKNKEFSNLCIILKKDNVYYLGVMNKNNKPAEEELEEDGSENSYIKMNYKLLPGPNKMLPKVFFSKSRIDEFAPSEELYRDYKAGKHKKGDSFDLVFCHELIDFFKKSLNKHPEWKEFDFSFTPTEEYEDISKFYEEVRQQGYKITYNSISEEKINQLVDEGKLYLFRIWNKDYAPGSTGRKNLHTLYWESIFDEKNIKDVICKLNGEAELFFRRASIEKPVKHSVGSKKVNRRDIDGNSIPEALYHEIYLYANGKKSSISAEAKKYIDEEKVRITEVKHELIKDKRYTENKYLFHVPMTINFKAPAKARISNEVNLFLKNNKDVNVIGIDRGERNLIYVTLINRNGEILLQKDYNTVNKTDYHSKLDEKSKVRDEARKSWKTIETIKELKEGYLSQVVHEIVTLAIENNAVIVMEDLNFGFKRGRFHVEKQVYQKFEKMLIDKLNYLVFKDKAGNEPCGILKGLQLTEKFESFQKIGKQNGIIFYIPAGYTSKIDPTTGFADVFNWSSAKKNQETQQKFMEKFTSIKYLPEEETFAFEANLDNFDTYQTLYKKEWELCTYGERIAGHKDKENGTWVTEYRMPTQEMKNLLTSEGIPYSQGEELSSYITAKGKEFASKMFWIFKNTVQMRNSNAEEDYIISPVKNSKGYFFDSRKADSSLPKDADANGAYHIALKGLCVLDRIDEYADEEGFIKTDKIKIPTDEWFKYAQTRNN